MVGCKKGKQETVGNSVTGNRSREPEEVSLLLSAGGILDRSVDEILILPPTWTV